MLKWFIIVSAIVVVAAGGFWFFHRGDGDEPQYQTEAVTRGDLTQAVMATGTLNPVVNVTVGSQVSGIINKLNVDYNSVVKSNEVIAEIDPSTYQAAVEQATADLANAKANLELQQAEANRSAELFKQTSWFQVPTTTQRSPLSTKPKPRCKSNKPCWTTRTQIWVTVKSARRWTAS